MNTMIIDAEGSPLGRVASYAAKKALLGESIVIVNCNEIVLIGDPAMILKKYKEAKERGGASLKGPFFPRSPEKIMKRTIRGMLYYKKGRGKDGFKKIKCYNDIPEEYESKKKKFSEKKASRKSIKLGELSKLI